MVRNHFTLGLLGSILLLTCLILWGCGKKLQPNVSTNSTPPPNTQRAPGTPRINDQIPIVDDGMVNGPGKSATYPPTEYVDLPLRKVALSNQPLRADNNCNFIGEVWDFAGEGDCQQVVATTEGYLFSIVGVPPGYYLEGGSRIRFGFSYDQTTQDNCRLTDGSIRVTCLQLLRAASGFPRPMVCRSYDQPSQWIYELTQDLGATYVTRFPWKDERLVYLFETPSGQYLYDCRGFILCQPPTNCLQFIEDFNTGVQIFEG